MVFSTAEVETGRLSGETTRAVAYLFGYTRSVAYLMLSCLVTRGCQWRVFCSAVLLHEDGNGGSSAQLFRYTRMVVADFLLSCLVTRGWQWPFILTCVITRGLQWRMSSAALFCTLRFKHKHRQGLRSSETLRGVDWLSTFGTGFRADFQGLLTACCWPYWPKHVADCIISKVVVFRRDMLWFRLPMQKYRWNFLFPVILAAVRMFVSVKQSQGLLFATLSRRDLRCA